MRKRGTIGMAMLAIAGVAILAVVPGSAASELDAAAMEAKRGLTGIQLTGTGARNNVEAFQEVDDDLVIRVPAPQTVTPAPNCTQDNPQQITCDAGAYDGIIFKGKGRADSFIGRTSLELITNLYGGTGGDHLNGGERFDFINGGDGRDTCKGGPGKEVIKNCE